MWQPSRWQKGRISASDSDRDAGAEDDIRADHGIAADDGVEGEEHGFGGGQGDAVLERLGPGAGLEDRLGRGEADAGVDAERLLLGAGLGGGGEAARAGNRDNVGQVVFAGRVVVGQPGNEIGENAARRRRRHRC